MATITIKDLHTNRVLDREAMSAIRGAAGAQWVFGWMRPYVEAAGRSGGIVNFYQTNHIYVADQMNNQIQVVDISNAAANANITVHANQLAGNVKQA